MCGILGFVEKSRGTPISKELFYDRITYLLCEMQREGARKDNDDATGVWHYYNSILKGNLPAKELVETKEYQDIMSGDVPPLFMGHTRYATVGSEHINTNNHPLFSDKYIMIHNGGVESDNTIDKKVYGEVDSYHILKVLDDTDSLEEVAKQVRGWAAILAVPIQQSEPTMYAYRDTRPLFIRYDQFGYWIASTEKALENLPGPNRKSTNYFKQLFDPYPIEQLPNGVGIEIKSGKATKLFKTLMKAKTYQAASKNTRNDRHVNSGVQNYFAYDYDDEDDENDVHFQNSESLGDSYLYTQNIVGAYICPTCGKHLDLPDSKKSYRVGTTTERCFFCEQFTQYSYNDIDLKIYTTLVNIEKNSEDLSMYMSYLDTKKDNVAMSINDRYVIFKSQILQTDSEIVLTKYTLVPIFVRKNYTSKDELSLLFNLTDTHSMYRTLDDIPIDNYTYFTDNNPNFKILQRQVLIDFYETDQSPDDTINAQDAILLAIDECEELCKKLISETSNDNRVSK